jgi:hypothetical protein
VHEVSLEVDVAFATPTLGALVSVVTPGHPRRIRKQSSSRCSTASSSGVDQRRSSKARSATTLTACSAKNRSTSPSSSAPSGAIQTGAQSDQDIRTGKGGRGRGQRLRTGQPIEQLTNDCIGHRPVMVPVERPVGHLPD